MGTTMEPRKQDEGDARIWSGSRPWPVKAITVLLFSQAVGLLLIGGLKTEWAAWQTAGWWGIVMRTPFFVTFPVLGVVALVAAVGFLFLRPGAWVMAMLAQGLCLLIALIFYFVRGTENAYLFLLMLTCIVMVIYLNYAEVPAVFRAQPGTVDGEAGP